MSRPRIVCCSLSAAGEELARRLPYEHRSSGIVETVAELWDEVDGLVLICATGIAIRAIAPHLQSKRSDPAVVCIDDAGRFAVCLTGGHAAGGNRLTRDVAALTGATPVVTTATDNRGLPALDAIPGLRCEGDVAAVTRSWLDGSPPVTGFDPGLEGWPLPAGIQAGGPGPGRVTLSDAARKPLPGEVLLKPTSLVVGVGSSSGAGTDALGGLVAGVLEEAGLDSGCVGAVATVDRKLEEPAIVALSRRMGAPLVAFTAAELSGVDVPNPSAAAADAVGTPSVSEAAALLAAGPGGQLLVAKTISATRDSTVAVARRRSPAGHLAVVGVGPGEPAKRTLESVAAIRAAEVVIGFSGYVDLIADLTEPRQEVHRSPIGAETERCRHALARSSSGARVALICSGDPGVYAMASLVMELSGEFGHPPVSVVPGVTAALTAAGVLGAPLGHDHAAVSLSDLLTPWDVIERRVKAVADGDFVVSLYNPRSGRRRSQLPRALEILAGARPPGTPAAVVTDAGRPGETVVRTTLGELDPESVGMLSIVLVGSTTTRWIGGRMVTPRGYGCPD